jgi:hypothetical protein
MVHRGEFGDRFCPGFITPWRHHDHLIPTEKGQRMAYPGEFLETLLKQLVSIH